MSPRRWNDDSEDKSGESAFMQDVLTNSFGMVALLLVVFLALVNKPGKENVSGATIPGNILIEAYWPNELDTDIDLWVMGPDGKPVGYSNKGEQYYNLLRDDLGRQSKDDPVNYELVTSRGIPPGGHCVNVHLYSNNSGVLPVPVKITVKIQKEMPGSASSKSGNDPVLVTEVQLKTKGQEMNVFCFKLDGSGVYLPEKTFSDQRVSLRSPSGATPWN